MNLPFRRMALLLCVLALGACAQQPPPFTPPAERPVTPSEAPWPSGQVLALAYHDVEDREADNRFVSVRTANLIEQLAWLRENGYRAVSIDQILAAQQGGAPLPDKALLLSFDDGFSSFRERVLPILKAYQWPAVLAPVGSWMSTPADQPVNFGGVPVPQDRFASPDQLREIVSSGLVELAAHTDNLHFGAQANPQGNLQPAAASRLYDAQLARYESDAEYRQRIKQDVQRISARLEAISGRAPRAWVWPYGAASGTALKIVGEQGYSLALTLEDGLSALNDLDNGHRHLVSGDPDIDRFASVISDIQNQGTTRVVHVDLDYIYDPDPEQLDANLGALVQRIADLRVSTVFLQAYADPEGDGTVRSLYFPNRHLPMRADLFNRVAWQLRTRAGVEVFAWMPVLAFDLDPALPRVLRWNPKTERTEVDPDHYQRLSPFDSRVRQQIGEIYEDLAAHSHFTGVLFHDDALLSDFEDVSPAALHAYREAGLGESVEQLRGDEEHLQRWTHFKTRFLTKFTLELAERVKAVRGPQIKTARNIYAQPILNPYSETWFAQNLDDFLASYDWTAPMAMPLMEGVSVEESEAWLATMVEQIARRPGALEKTVFELQARDWRSGHEAPIDDALLVRWMRRLQYQGVRHFGYYPDDYVSNQPSVEAIQPVISTAWSPLR